MLTQFKFFFVASKDTIVPKKCCRAKKTKKKVFLIRKVTLTYCLLLFFFYFCLKHPLRKPCHAIKHKPRKKLFITNRQTDSRAFHEVFVVKWRCLRKRRKIFYPQKNTEPHHLPVEIIQANGFRKKKKQKKKILYHLSSNKACQTFPRLVSSSSFSFQKNYSFFFLESFLLPWRTSTMRIVIMHCYF